VVARLSRWTDQDGDVGEAVDSERTQLVPQLRNVCKKYQVFLQSASCICQPIQTIPPFASNFYRVKKLHRNSRMSARKGAFVSGSGTSNRALPASSKK
jgi:hypothetical protein